VDEVVGSGSADVDGSDTVVGAGADEDEEAGGGSEDCCGGGSWEV
jgi:hypothetical protein